MRRRMDWMQNAILNLHQEQVENEAAAPRRRGYAPERGPETEEDPDSFLPLLGGGLEPGEYPETICFPKVTALPVDEAAKELLCAEYLLLLHCDFAVAYGCGDDKNEQMRHVDMFLSEIEGRMGGSNVPIRRRLIFQYKGTLYHLVGYSVLTQVVISEVNSLLAEPGIHDLLLHCNDIKDKDHKGLLDKFFYTIILSDPVVCIMFAHVAAMAILVNGMMTQENYTDPKTLRLKMLTLNRLKKELRHRVHKNIDHKCDRDKRFADL